MIRICFFNAMNNNTHFLRVFITMSSKYKLLLVNYFSLNVVFWSWNGTQIYDLLLFSSIVTSNLCLCIQQTYTGAGLGSNFYRPRELLCCCLLKRSSEISDLEKKKQLTNWFLSMVDTNIERLTDRYYWFW